MYKRQFFVCYGGAQLFSGLLADRLRPRLLVAVGLLLSLIHI